MATLSSQPSPASDCVNYWTHPRTGQQECLGQDLQIVQRSPAAANEASVESGELEPGEFEFPDIAEFEAAIADWIKGLEVLTLEGSATGLVDHLKGCQPYRYSLALEFMPEMAISQTVIGDRDGNCAVNVSVNMPDTNGEETVARCQFTPASIATLTDSQSYAEAQALDSNNWDAIGEISAARGSAIFERECQSVDPS